MLKPRRRAGQLILAIVIAFLAAPLRAQPESYNYLGAHSSYLPNARQARVSTSTVPGAVAIRPAVQPVRYAALPRPRVSTVDVLTPPPLPDTWETPSTGSGKKHDSATTEDTSRAAELLEPPAPWVLARAAARAAKESSDGASFTVGTVVFEGTTPRVKTAGAAGSWRSAPEPAAAAAR
jgi:hypothetical protein